MNYLEMKHIKKHFDELEVLKDISLNVREGQVVAIIGPSGSGANQHCFAVRPCLKRSMMESFLILGSVPLTVRTVRRSMKHRAN